MVQQGDFVVQLVDAETKQPFKEHTTEDGKVYVEVEPDAEYFISVQKVGTSHPGASYLKFVIDEKEMKYFLARSGHKVEASPSLCGLLRIENGTSFHNALKFEKPNVQEGKGGSNLLMGKVEVKIHDGVFQGYQVKDEGYSFSTSIATADVGKQHASVATKKSLRTGEGSATTKATSYTGRKSIYIPGDHLYTISLNYCSALGLMEVGVIPKPGLWEHHRMKQPATDIPESSKKASGSGKENDAIEFEDDDDCTMM